MTALGRLMIWAIVMVLGFLADPALADRTIAGRITTVVAGTPVRLNGVDGPETSTHVGGEARTFMARLVQGETVSCVLDGTRPTTGGSGCVFSTDRISVRSPSRTASRSTVGVILVGATGTSRPRRPGPGFRGQGIVDDMGVRHHHSATFAFGGDSSPEISGGG